MCLALKAAREQGGGLGAALQVVSAHLGSAAEWSEFPHACPDPISASSHLNHQGHLNHQIVSHFTDEEAELTGVMRSAWGQAARKWQSRM